MRGALGVLIAFSMSSACVADGARGSNEEPEQPDAATAKPSRGGASPVGEGGRPALGAQFEPPPVIEPSAPAADPIARAAASATASATLYPFAPGLPVLTVRSSSAGQPAAISGGVGASIAGTGAAGSDSCALIDTLIDARTRGRGQSVGGAAACDELLGRLLRDDDARRLLAGAGRFAPSGGVGSAAVSGGRPAAGSGGAGEVAGPKAGAGLSASAVFSAVGEGVTLSVVLDRCQPGKLYPIHIHEGDSCADAMAPGAYWDQPRGEDIPDLECGGANRASLGYVRSNSSAKPWSVGAPDASNLVGRTLVLNDPNDRTLRIACGVISMP
jgi:hypothetical protein